MTVTDPDRPTLPAALEPDVITAALRASGVLEAGTSVVAVRGAPVGQGHMGDSYLIECGYDRSEAGPSRLFAKLPATDPASAALDRSIGAFDRERHMYESVLPTLQVSAPRFFGTLLLDGRPQGLLLEDLSARRSVDQIAGASVELLENALSELPKLHAGSWDDEAYGRQGWLFNRFARLPELTERYQSSWAALGELVGSGFSADQREVIERFGAACPEWASSIDGPRTVIHQDLRLDNLLFGDGRSWLLDWQVVGWGPPTADLAYLVSTSVTPEDRRRGERGWIEDYLLGLADLGVNGWTADDAWSSYRRMTFYTLLGLIPSMGHVKRTDRGIEMYRSMLERATTQILDLDALDFLTH